MRKDNDGVSEANDEIELSTLSVIVEDAEEQAGSKQGNARISPREERRSGPQVADADTVRAAEENRALRLNLRVSSSRYLRKFYEDLMQSTSAQTAAPLDDIPSDPPANMHGQEKRRFSLAVPAQRAFPLEYRRRASIDPSVLAAVDLWEHGGQPLPVPEKITELGKPKLRCCERDMKLRSFIRKIVSHSIFEVAILLVVIASIVVLVINGNGSTKAVLSWTYDFNIAVAIIFVLEVILKIIAFGFVKGEAAYFRSSWNRLDFIATVVTVVDLIPGLEAVPSLSAIRALRILRVLRAFKFFGGLRAILSSLRKSAPLLLDVVAFMAFFFLVTGLFSVAFFGGVLRNHCIISYNNVSTIELLPSICVNQTKNGTITSNCDDHFVCADVSVVNRTEVRVVDEDGEEVQWSNPDQDLTSFDNILLATLTNFRCVTTDNWQDIMHDIMDGGLTAAWVYFVLVVLFGSFLIVPLFVGVLTASFAKVRDEEQHSAFESEGFLTTWKKCRTRICGRENAQTADSSFKKRCLCSARKRNQNDKDREKTSSFRQSLRRIAEHKGFTAAIVFLILSNSIWMALEHYPSSDVFAQVLSTGEMVFTCLFIVELVFMIGAYGFKGYFGKRSNIFDFCIVSVSVVQVVVELIATNILNSTSTVITSNFTVLRILRISRVLRIARVLEKQRSVRQLLDTVFGSLTSLLNVVLFISFTFVCFGVLGMQLFQGYFPASSRNNFDNFSSSLLSLFMIMTGEWTSILTDGLTVSVRHPETSVFLVIISPFFFVGFYIVSNYVLLNLFVAIVLERFEMAEQEKYKLQNEAFTKALVTRAVVYEQTNTDKSKSLSRNSSDVSASDRSDKKSEESGNRLKYATKAIIRKLKTVSSHDASEVTEVSKRDSSIEYTTATLRSDFVRNLAGVSSDDLEDLIEEEKTEAMKQEHGNMAQSRRLARQDSFMRRISTAILRPTTASETNSSRNLAISALQKSRSFSVHNSARKSGKPASRFMRRPFTLFCIPDDSHLRKFTLRLTSNKWFDRVILGFILASAVVLAAEDTVSRDPACQCRYFYEGADIIFAIVFLSEFVLKIIANGFLFKEGAYLRNGFNVLDFFVLVVSSVDVLLTLLVIGFGPQSVDSGTVVADLGAGRVLRILRTLRALRMINKAEGMKVVVTSLIYALPMAGNVVVLSLVFLFIYAVMGVNSLTNETVMSVYGGLLKRSCNLSDSAPCPEGYEYDGAFNNVPLALATLVEVSSLEGWDVVMWRTVDDAAIEAVNNTNISASEALQDPIGMQAYGHVFFFLSFIFICSFFILQLFIGVFTESFQKCSGSGLLTVKQRTWQDMRKFMAIAKPSKAYKPPKTPMRKYCFLMTQSCPWSKQDCPYGRLHRFHSSFDTVMMSFIILNVALLLFDHYGQPAMWTTVISIGNYIFLSIFALEMLVKLLALGPYYFRSPWNVFDCVLVVTSVISAVALSSLPQGFQVIRVFRIGRALRLIKKAAGIRTLVNALILGLPAMANVTLLVFLIFYIYAIIGMELFGSIDTLPRYTNYASFPSAMLLLFQMATGEGWNSVMHTIIAYPDHPHPAIVYLYFISFVYIGSYLCLSIYVAAMIENFHYCFDVSDAALSERSIKLYKKTWAKYDPDSLGYIPNSRIRAFIEELEEPLGSGGKGLPERMFRSIMREIRSVEVPGKGVPFRKLLVILGVTELGMDALTVQDRLSRFEKMLELLREEAACLIQSAARGYILRKQRNKAGETSIEQASTAKKKGISNDNDRALFPPSPSSGNSSKRNSLFLAKRLSLVQSVELRAAVGLKLGALAQSEAELRVEEQKAKGNSLLERGSRVIRRASVSLSTPRNRPIQQAVLSDASTQSPSLTRLQDLRTSKRRGSAADIAYAEVQIRKETTRRDVAPSTPSTRPFSLPIRRSGSSSND